MSEDFEARLKAHMEKYRSEHQDEPLKDVEIMKRILADLGIKPGASVEIVNNKSNKDTIVLIVEFEMPKPIDYIIIEATEKKELD